MEATRTEALQGSMPNVAGIVKRPVWLAQGDIEELRKVPGDQIVTGPYRPC